MANGKVHCRHVYKAAPGWPGECTRHHVDPVEKQPRHVPRACVPTEEFRYGRNRDDRRCCWYCPNLQRCGHPNWLCPDALRLMAARLEPGFRVEGELV